MNVIPTEALRGSPEVEEIKKYFEAKKIMFLEAERTIRKGKPCQELPKIFPPTKKK